MTDEIAEQRSLVVAASDMKKIATGIAALYVKASELVGAMKPLADRSLVESILVSRGGVSAEDASTLYELDRILEGNRDVLHRKPLSIAAIKAFVDAPEDVREQVFGLLSKGQIVEVEDIAKIADHNDREATSEWERQERVRATYLQSLIGRQASFAISSIEERCDALVRLIDEFVFDYVPYREDGDEMSIDKAGYFDSHKQISAQAGDLLIEIDRWFPHGESFGNSHEEHERAFLEARRALGRFATGRFAHNGGFALDQGKADVHSYEIVSALTYLIPAKSARDSADITRPTAAPPLKVLELCAGAGGMAIGLMAAGFEHAALYEKSGVRVDTLKRNWPDWQVFEQDLARIPDEVWRSYEGVDLVAGGPPCKAFSQTGLKEGATSRHNLFPEAVRAVRLAKPRAFVFENVLGLAHEPNAEFLAKLRQEFKGLGYRAREHVLDGASFGLPQSRKRIFIVGLRDDVPSLFQIPKPSPPVERFVAEVLGPAMIRYETPEHLKNEVTENSRQWTYDRWAEKWRESHAKSRIPTVTTFKEEKRSKRKDPWHLAGFDFSEVVVDPPTIDDIESIDWKPKITIEALALSQGFPAGWQFLAKKTGQIAMIGDALPPVMAMAVGFAIRSALTGEGFDLHDALVTPLIVQARIGRKRRPLRDVPEDYRAASRVADGERIETVEPNPKRRKRLVALAELIVASRQAEAEGEPGYTPSNRMLADHIRARQKFRSA